MNAVSNPPPWLSLVQADVSASRALAARLLGLRDATRGASLTIALGLGGLALTVGEALLAIAAAVVVAVLGYVDARYGLLFGQVVARTAQQEKILAEYFRTLLESGATKQRAEERLDHRLRAYNVGSEQALTRTRFSNLFRALRRPLWWSHVVLIVILLAVAASIGTDDETPVCLADADGGFVAQVSSLGDVEDGAVTIVPCEE